MRHQRLDLAVSIRKSVSRLIGVGLAIVTIWSAINHYYGGFQGGIAWLDASANSVHELQRQNERQLIYNAREVLNSNSFTLSHGELSVIFEERGGRWEQTYLREGQREQTHQAQTQSHDDKGGPSQLISVLSSWVQRQHETITDEEAFSSYLDHQGAFHSFGVARRGSKIALFSRPLGQARVDFLQDITAVELILTDTRSHVRHTTFKCDGPCHTTYDGYKFTSDVGKSRYARLQLDHPYHGAYKQFHVGNLAMGTFVSGVSIKTRSGEHLGYIWLLIPEDVMLYWPKLGIIGLVTFGILIFIILIRRLTRLTRERLAPLTDMVQEVSQLNQSLMQSDFMEEPLSTYKSEPGDEVEKLREVLNVLRTHLEANERLANQLRQSQKMEVIGTLAGGVAHDFNNLMSVILFNSECMQESLSKLSVQPDSGEPKSTSVLTENNETVSVPEIEFEEWRELVAEMLIACDQAKTLTQQLLSISRDQRHQDTPFSVYQCVSEVRTLFRRLISEHIRVNVQISESDLWISGNENSFKQALMNVIINARDALSGHPGLLSLKVSHHKQHQDELLTAGALKVDDYVLFSVEDTGGGIPTEDIEHLFNPFFSSKGAKGTGLGLTIVYNTVVKHMRGAIRVTSTIGEGTKFEIFIPHVEPLRESVTPIFPVSESQVSAERIVVIEDHDIVRRTLTHTLKGLGFIVTDFASGVEFIQWFEQNHHLVDLVLSDVVMPDMSGPEVWSIAREMRADLPFIFLTGYTGEAVSRYSVPPELILSKPISTRELKNKLLEVLGASVADL